MKFFKDLFRSVITVKPPNQICAFDARTGWGKANSPLPTHSGSPSETHKDLLRQLRETHEPFWGSCECCCDEGLILYRPRVAARKQWLAYVKGRGTYELVLLSDLGSAMEFMRLYAPGLVSIPDNHRVPGLLEEMLELLSGLEAGPYPDVIR
jgi:hypothetical protein